MAAKIKRDARWHKQFKEFPGNSRSVIPAQAGQKRMAH
jgi:hypothetical protein